VKIARLDGLFAWDERAWAALVESGDLAADLRRLDSAARSTPTCLLLANLDGCRDAPDEAATVGWIRSLVQRCQHIAVVSTVADPGFLGRHFGDPLGAFFKQAAVCEVPAVATGEIDRWVRAWVGASLEPAARRRIVDTAGLLPGDLCVLMRALQDGRRRSPHQGAVDVPEVIEAVDAIVDERRTLYGHIVFTQMNHRHRRVLQALACDAAVDAGKRSVLATGVGKGSLPAVFKRLEANGWIFRGHSGWEFSDPFLRCFLRTA
jgi:hypothetical protein